MVRYVLNKDIRFLNASSALTGEKLSIPNNHGGFGWYVNILEKSNKDDIMKLRVYLKDGEEFIDGYIHSSVDPLTLSNRYELFDGRFNA